MSGIRREYEITIGDEYWAVDVWIEDTADGLRSTVDSYVHTVTFSAEGERLELPAGVRVQVEVLINRDSQAIRRELDEAAYDQAVDAKISERKEGGN